jgi:hypothetical protein
MPRDKDQSTEFDHAKEPFQKVDEAESDNQIVNIHATVLVYLTVCLSPLISQMLEGKQTPKLF